MNFNFIRMFTDEKGETHFEELPTWDMAEHVPGINFSDLKNCEGFFLETFSADFFEDWHNPPEGQRFISFFIEGQMRFEVSDGSTKTLGPGDVMFFEDVTGKGHLTFGVKAGKALLIKQ